MIPRFDLDGVASLHPARWPDPPERPPLSPFQPRRALRHLRVVVELDALVNDGTDPWSARRLLTGLLRHPFLQVSRYRDAGPPTDAPMHQVPHGAGKARGWITLVGDPTST